MRSGFTLLELLLVLAIIVLVAGIALVNFDTAYDEIKLNSAADAVRRSWAQARAEAIDAQVAYRYAVIPNTSRYRIAPDLPEYWNQSITTATESSETGQPLQIIEGELPEKIVFDFGGASLDTGDAAAAGGDWVPVVTFLPGGGASDDRNVTLRMKNCRPVRVSVRALTGSVKIQTLQQGEVP